MASVPVLMYHHVAPDREVTPAGFERQLDWLAANGYRTLSADELAAHMSGAYPAPKRSVALTFDDGYADNWVYAYPALKRRKMKAHLFIVTSRVTEAARRPHAGEGGVLADTQTAERAPEGFASWSELAEMSKEGVFQIGSHTHSHRDWLRTAAYADLPGELETSKRLIEERLGAWPGTLAWPWGDFQPEWLALLKPRGYRLAFTTVVGPNTPGTSALRVERFKVQNDDVSWLAKRLWLYGKPALAKTYQRLYGLDRKFWQAVGLK